MQMADYLNFHGIGHIGVMLFFVLSGFLLSISVMHNEYTYRSYIIRRFFRIAPLYYTILICLYIYQTYIGVSDTRYLHIDLGIFEFIKHLLFLKGDSVFWTLPVEFMFYFILPFLVLLIIKDYSWVYLLVMISFLYSLYHFLIYAGYNTLPALKIVEIQHSSQFISLFLLGVIAGVTSKNKLVLTIYKRNESKYNILVNIVFTIVIILSFILVSKNLFGFEQPLYLIRFVSFGYAVVFGAVLFSLANGNIFLRNIFMNKILIFMGHVGFSWYLLHMLIIEIVNKYSLESWEKFIISTVFIAILSYISFKMIEEPFMKLGKIISIKYS